MYIGDKIPSSNSETETGCETTDIHGVEDEESSEGSSKLPSSNKSSKSAHVAKNT